MQKPTLLERLNATIEKIKKTEFYKNSTPQMQGGLIHLANVGPFASALEWKASGLTYEQWEQMMEGQGARLTPVAKSVVKELFNQ